MWLEEDSSLILLYCGISFGHSSIQQDGDVTVLIVERNRIVGESNPSLVHISIYIVFLMSMTP